MKLKRVEFDEIGFRNLRKLSIDIAPRLTVIAGHNGIGKSTILGIIANGTELKETSKVLKRPFRSDFSEIFYLDYDEDFKRDLGSSRASLIYEVSGVEVTKDCQVTGGQKELVNNKKFKKGHMVKVDERELTEKQAEQLLKKKQETGEEYTYKYRMRLIPRSKKNDQLSDDVIEKFNLSDSAKAKLPTLYIGMSRVNPIGEFATDSVSVKKVKLKKETYDFIQQVFNDILPYRKQDNEKVFFHDYDTSNKRSVIPDLGHSSMTISLGQDSLSSIVSAIASFYELKNELKNEYSGGILIIDEIEAGLHPKAQRKLMKQLKKYSHKLNLQIIITSHSLVVVEETLDENNKGEYGVVYLQDTKLPQVMQSPTYLKIKNDMQLTKHQPPSDITEQKPKLDIYFEDLEAYDFFNAIL